jgi:hypothetical protein
MSQLPPCGLYRTTAKIGEIDAGRLVYFHNHGDPGPGLYLPTGWSHNTARWSPRGVTAPADFDGAALKPLPREGFYRVKASFYCCSKQCRKFEPEALVQLGYNGAGRALVFVPELSAGTITVPERGSMVDDDVLGNLVALQLPERKEREDLSLPRGIVIH